MSVTEIYHLQALEKLIMKCLNEASSANQRSIALPALGTGMLSYDRSLVAKCMFRCVKHFERDNPSTKLQDVRFVIYPDDTASYQAFERRVKRKEDSNGNSGLSTCSVFYILL